MDSGRNRNRAGRCPLDQVLLLLFLLPALLCGQALGGETAWFHSHGHAGDHLHVLFSSSDLDKHENASAVQHLHPHDTLAPEEEQHAPEGVLIKLPRILAASTRNASQPQAPLMEASATLPPARWYLALTERIHRPDVCRSGWPPEGRELSGVEALLRSSRAIRI